MALAPAVWLLRHLNVAIDLQWEIWKFAPSTAAMDTFADVRW